MNLRMPLLTALLATLSCLVSAGEAASAESLFERLGGTDRVTAIVNATVDGLAGNFRETSLGNREPQVVKNELVRRICAVTGGGCRYRGAAIAGSDLAGTELVEALRVAMRTHGVPLAARNELLEALAPTRRAGAALALNPRK